jgi:hypothetical protein
MLRIMGGSKGEATAGVGQVALIPLRRRDGSVRAYAIIDAADYIAVIAHRWHLTGRGRVARGDGAYLSRDLLGVSDPDIHVDHRNGDKLDNRRANLRPGTCIQNVQNRAVPHGRNTSGHRGVTWHRQRQKWAAQAVVNYRHHHLGLFDDVNEAARVAAAFRAQSMPSSADADEVAA